MADSNNPSLKELIEKSLRYAAIVELSDDAIITHTLDGEITSWNAGATKMYGYSADELVSNPASILIPDEFKKIDTILLEKVRKGETVSHYETVRRKKYGALIHVSVSMSPILNESGVITGVSKIVRDITSQKDTEAVLRKNEKNFRFILENSPIAVRVSSMVDGRVIYANNNYCEFTELKMDEAIGVDPRKFYSNPEEYDIVSNDLKSGKSVINKLVRFENGRSVKWGMASFMPLNFENEPSILGWIYDITAQKQLEEQALELALYDPLTALPNRRLFDDHMKLAIASSKRTGIYGAVLFLDLDHFKTLNDTHGHHVGDLLLIEVGKRIVNCVRDEETVARFGGDEFVVILTQLDTDEKNSRKKASTVAEKIRKSLGKSYLLKYTNVNNVEVCIEHVCTSSIGIALFNAFESRAEHILKQADRAMYQAKSEGRNLIRFSE
jgi:diguanylate cyclase (GGDEF)-like protein/PAS domain S-box-containing protein